MSRPTMEELRKLAADAEQMMVLRAFAEAVDEWCGTTEIDVTCGFCGAELLGGGTEHWDGCPHEEYEAWVEWKTTQR